jgi:hypothetical protein
MFEKPLHKINSFRENHKLNLINEYKNSLLSLNKNSIFMRKVIESKEKERKSRKKTFEINTAKDICNYENVNAEDRFTYNNVSKFTYLQNNNIKTESSISKERENTKMTENVLNEYIKNSSIISSRNKKFKNQIKEKSSFPINDSYKTIISSINFKNDSFSNRNKSGCETDRYVLNYNGKKIFATFSFNESNNKTICPRRNNDTELFRNYSKLKLKKEEIYNRKIKKDSSAERKELWTIEKEKELKDQNLAILSKEKKNRAQYAKKVKKIPLGNKRIFESQNCIKKGNQISLRKKDINSFTLTQDDEDTLKSLSKNTIESTNKSKTKNKSLSFSSNNTSNNNTNSCAIEKMINAISINNKLKYNLYSQNFNDKILVNQNINYERKELSNSKDLNIYKIHKLIDMPKFIESKKKFVEDELKESMIVTNDKRLTIKIHCIHNLNQLFLLRRKKRNFKIQKVINILLSSEKKFYLNYLWNNQLSNKIRAFKNYNSLSSIKEEEKSKAELTNSELQIDTQEKQSNFNQAKDRIKLKNIILKENSYFSMQK